MGQTDSLTFGAKDDNSFLLETLISRYVCRVYYIHVHIAFFNNVRLSHVMCQWWLACKLDMSNFRGWYILRYVASLFSRTFSNISIQNCDCLENINADWKLNCKRRTTVCAQQTMYWSLPCYPLENTDLRNIFAVNRCKYLRIMNNCLCDSYFCNCIFRLFKKTKLNILLFILNMYVCTHQFGLENIYNKLRMNICQ